VLEFGDAIEVDVKRLVAQLLLAWITVDGLLESRENVYVNEHGDVPLSRWTEWMGTGRFPAT